MNQRFSPLEATRAQERAAFRSLALTQKRLSWVYYHWAKEAERDGKLTDYRHYRDTSDRYRREARDHLDLARRR